MKCCCIYMNETKELGHPLFAICCASRTLVIFLVNQGVGDLRAFLKEFKERVLSLYRQEWDNSIRTKERFIFYSTFKSFLSLAPYLNELKHIKARNFLIRLRLDVSPLRTHKLRYWKDATPVDYFRPFCKSDVETGPLHSRPSEICRN